MDFRTIANRFITAEAQCKPFQPITAEYPDLTVEDAYGIQMAQVETKLEQGRTIIGKKIGLTSRGMQQLLGVDEPDYGHLLDNMLLMEGESCPREDLINPKVEAEIAFILKDTLRGPGVTIADVLKATEGVMAAFEVVDSRIANWNIKLADTVADNASSARFVLGSRLVPVKKLDLRLMGMMLEKNGKMFNNGAGGAVLGHPAAAVAWLANKLGSFGVALKANEIILSGAVTAAADADQGDVFTASFHGLGSLNLKFT